jgi:hypothetical protein
MPHRIAAAVGFALIGSRLRAQLRVAAVRLALAVGCHDFTSRADFERRRWRDNCRRELLKLRQPFVHIEKPGLPRRLHITAEEQTADLCFLKKRDLTLACLSSALKDAKLSE